MTFTVCCTICGTDDPRWSLLRVNDSVVSWACDGFNHLSLAAASLQRDGEITELVVRDRRKVQPNA